MLSQKCHIHSLLIHILFYNTNAAPYDLTDSDALCSYETCTYFYYLNTTENLCTKHYWQKILC